uniref:EF-hand domain-containing protein n=1 Tax=Globisporangium ultimum (strain ATCC 200006 / CBS 805.95 / DAOM BR144) TaxID=431595 RepID=K3WG05_GLOUD
MLSFSRCRKMKQTALLSVALGISEDHIQQEMAAEVFHSMDQSKKGTLTRDEFCNSMVECGISQQDAADLFTRINQSKTGQINFLEFIAAVMDQRDIGQNTIKEAFGLLDGEKKGRLSIVGLQDVFKNSLVPEEVQEMIASADKKGDGFVDFASFQDMFAQPNSPLAKVDEVSTDSFVSSDDAEKRATLTSSSFAVSGTDPLGVTTSGVRVEINGDRGTKTPTAAESNVTIAVAPESPTKPTGNAASAIQAPSSDAATTVTPSS